MCCTVQRFCCACSLKTGALIIGILEAIFSAAGLIVLILIATSLAVVVSGVVDHPETSKEEAELIHGGSKVLLIVTCVMGVLVALQMVMSILLACGASNENPKLIKPWIIYSITGLTIIILLCLVMGGVAFAVNNIEAGVKFLIFCITTAVVQIYCMIVVNSYHGELTRTRTGRTYAEVPQDIALQNYST
ncbi:uncharacterized protein [Anabrus simplex]|uniref:uncharacterized protein n=1 Tax=Anabrus simplex TaxID=316456 RepID=UPI0035A31716